MRVLLFKGKAAPTFLKFKSLAYTFPDLTLGELERQAK